MTLRHEGEYDLNEVAGCYRVVALDHTGEVDLNEARVGNGHEDSDTLHLVAEAGVTVAFDPIRGFFIIDADDSDEKPIDLYRAVDRLVASGELTEHSLDSEGRILVISHFEAPAEHGPEEPTYVTDMCARIKRAIEEELWAIEDESRNALASANT